MPTLLLQAFALPIYNPQNFMMDIAPRYLIAYKAKARASKKMYIAGTNINYLNFILLSKQY